MTNPTGGADARLALSSIEARRRPGIAGIDVPRWYWWALALAWLALGVVADLAHPWALAGGTLTFGAVHSAVAHHVLAGQSRSRSLSLHSRRLPALMLACLLGLGAVTVGLGFLADADGADHPATIASIVVAVAILCGGPGLMAAVRRSAERTVSG